MSKSKKAETRKARKQRRKERRADKQHEQQNFDDRPVVARVKKMKERPLPLNEAQVDYDDAMAESKVIFGIGPAGTGKTWFAAVRAAESLENGEIERIYVTRPVIEAEEDGLGFLPGDLNEKYEPYLRPVKEALEEYFGTGHLEYLLRNKIIEPRPLAYLRGATLKNCWVIADEMQNATRGQMKLLLTRFGENAKFIVNGDPSQVDIPLDKSGLMDASKRLSKVKNIETIEFDRQDIVREGLVQKIVEAYEG